MKDRGGRKRQTQNETETERRGGRDIKRDREEWEKRERVRGKETWMGERER